MTQSATSLSRRARQLLEQMVTTLHSYQLPLNHPWIIVFNRSTNTTSLRLNGEDAEDINQPYDDCFVAVMELLQGNYLSVESLQQGWWEISLA
jgi:hypothetical protein